MPPEDDERRALLRAAPWGKLHAQLTAIALKRTRARSLELAKDLAQDAVADAYRRVDDGGWDPSRSPLEGFLVARVLSSAANEMRRKRNQCEVWLDEEVEETGRSVHEKHLATGAAAPDEALHHLRFASALDERLTARLAGKPVALSLLPFLREGLNTPRDLAAASGHSLEEVRAARRSIRYFAEEITRELSATAAPSSPGASGPNEVLQ